MAYDFRILEYERMSRGLTSKPAVRARFTEAKNDSLKLAISSNVIHLGTQVCGASNGMSLALMTLSGHPPTYASH